MKEFVSAVQENLDEATADVIKFKIDGKEVHAKRPHSGQLTFMLAALGRGQDDSQRYASLINLLCATLRPEDSDYLQGRLIEPDPKKRLPLQVVEEVFEFLVEEWFREGEDVPSDEAAV